MRRNWQTVRGEGGDDAAAQYATALAQIADAELIESIVHSVAALNRFGGELRIAAYRQKFDAAGNRVDNGAVGTHETVGYLYDYNHHFKQAPDEKNYNPDRDGAPEFEDPRDELADAAEEEPDVDLDAFVEEQAALEGRGAHGEPASEEIPVG